MDDIIVFANRRHIEKILEVFNSLHDKIKFTLEHETAGELAFLDTKLFKLNNNTVATKWYHKPTWAGRYCNFDSFLPYQYKVNTISMLTRKAYTIAHPSTHTESFELIKNTLVTNNYPLELINKVMNDTIKKKKKIDNEGLDSNSSSSNSSSSNSLPIRYLAVPYNNTIYGKLSLLLKDYNIKVIGKPYNSGKIFYSNLKDKTDKMSLSHVVYKITCSCAQSYIGQTKQYLIKRFTQHIKGNEEHSALSNHLHSTGHSILFQNTSILCRENNTKKRLIKEAVYIQNQKCMNFQLDSETLSRAYDLLFSVIF
jgi:predicted GIY-YIG superfamily endonuclease